MGRPSLGNLKQAAIYWRRCPLPDGLRQSHHPTAASGASKDAAETRFDTAPSPIDGRYSAGWAALPPRRCLLERRLGMHQEGAEGAKHEQPDRHDEGQIPVAGHVDDIACHQRRDDRGKGRAGVHQARRRAGIFRRDVHRHRPDRADDDFDEEEAGGKT